MFKSEIVVGSGRWGGLLLSGLLALICALLMAAGLASPAQAADFTVTKTADTNDGVCDSDCSLREAIIAANGTAGADEVVVPAGTYTLTIAGAGEEFAATGDLDITDNVTITGAGKDSTVIDGNRLDRLFDIRSNKAVAISRVTVQNGNGFGGGGGGVLNNGGTATFDNVRFIANLAGTGGAMDNEGTATLTNSEFIGNRAQGSYGGAITQFNPSAKLSLRNATFDHNLANNNGGAINMNGDLNLDTVTFTGNRSFAAAHGGGAVLIFQGHATINNTTFADNHTSNSGGGLYLNEVTSTPSSITNSTFSGNTAALAGGGIYGFGSVNLTNTTIADNTTSSASSSGGIHWNNVKPSLKNSIVASNGPRNCNASVTSRGYNLEHPGTSCGFNGTGDLSNTDPKLGPLQDNGGPTKTHALLKGSPAIDAGDGANAPSTDQRGVSRPQDGDGDGNAVHDIGAFELEEPDPPANEPPTVDAGGPYNVNEGGSTTVSATGTDPENGTLTYEWDLDNDGEFDDATGQNATFSAANLDGPSSHTIKVRVKDPEGLSATAEATVNVHNVKPTASFKSPTSVDEGSSISLSLDSPSDPGEADTTKGFEYAFDCGGGYGAFSSQSTSSCPKEDDNGTRAVKGIIRDKDGGETEYTSSVTVNNVAPTATFNPSAPVDEGSAFELSLTNPSDPSGADTTAGFKYAFDCGDSAGYGAFSSTSTASCPTDDNGARAVRGKIQDKDGGETEYTGSVDVNNVAPTVTGITSVLKALTGGTISFTGAATDPSTKDTDEGFSWLWSFDRGSSYNSGSNPVEKSFDTCGDYYVSAKALDKDGGESAPFDLVNNPIKVYDAEFHPPVEGGVTGDVENTVQARRTVPLKISITDCDGNPVTGLKPIVKLVQGNQTPGGEASSSTTVDEMLSSSEADSGYEMREVDDQYHYNLKIPDAENGTHYTAKIQIWDDNTEAVMYALFKVRNN